MCCTTLINRFKIRKKEISRIIDNNTDFPLHFLIYIVINDLENNLKRYPLDKYRLNIFTQIYLVPRSDQKQLETISTKIEAEDYTERVTVYFNFSTIDRESISGILGNENHAPFSIMHKGSIFVSTCIRVNNDGG